MFDWITGLISQSGLPGIFLLMLGENMFPPIPSEVIMPLGGFLVEKGELTMPGVIIAGSLGSLLGTTLWYWAAVRLGDQRMRDLIVNYGRWLTMSEADYDRARDWFERHGNLAVLIGRMIPGVRTLISVPAGLTGMPITRFLALSLVGSVIWVALLTAAGYALGSQFALVSDWINPVSNLLFAGLAIVYVYRLFTHKGA
ncbi:MULTISPECIES: DedA family protein [Roseobacteraceae]|jgi:membrane protein DedA with SNARE-associated domain|uniref:Inner membrane protein YqjA n=1 Tax=Pseudosulfitobacter pseudonitzschiae TaxID=1402135 RepID=A0A221K1R7_9RHOB|nr:MULTISPECIES: DedA family protein [Roseobacteraceae]ASM72936.1 inner membrane protein YqjA [Pseudosulfitobacter pseudonitzschiae]